LSNPADTDAASASVVGKIGASLAPLRWSSNNPQVARVRTHTLFLDTHRGRPAEITAQPPKHTQAAAKSPGIR
jgi:hypothetical protein